MKQLVILSGKGGTGKTTLASAFISFKQARAYADCDVDAPNLHLVTSQKGQALESDYYGLPKAWIDNDRCIGCDECRGACRFSAISLVDGFYHVDPFHCEGCGVCHYVCPVEAVEMQEVAAGELMLYKNEEVFSTARLKMGSGNSGLLVTEVKKALKENTDADFAIIDGSPGIGCPVIASLSDVDYTLIVAEPSLSGISDMKRILRTASLQGVRAGVCVNKYDLNLDNTRAIEAFCQENHIDYLGRIPFDESALEAVNSGKTIADLDCPSGRAARRVFEGLVSYMDDEGAFIIKRSW